MNNIAILQVADTSPLESLVVMLRSVGYDCHLPSDALKRVLRDLGCDTVLDVKGLVENWGYDQPFALPEAGVADMSRTDVLYVDVKAHRNGPKVWKRWPHLEKRTLWYRINGAQPEHVVNASGDHGDEVNPPCPVLTPNQWYGKECTCGADRTGTSAEAHEPNCAAGLNWTVTGKETAYAFWPPFHRFAEFETPRVTDKDNKQRFGAPICLIHRVEGWGYQDLIGPMRELLGVRMHGVGSPDGLLLHREVGSQLSSALCMVHLKSNDAPGYALYEALAAACPIVCTRRLIWRSKMQDLLIPGKTCLVFDKETHDGLLPCDIDECMSEVKKHIKTLADPNENRRIGEAGRTRLKEIMWSVDQVPDVAELGDFMRRNFK